MTTQTPDPATVRAALDRLAATVAGMTDAEPGTGVWAERGGEIYQGGFMLAATPYENGNSIPAGIAALRNAADALIDVATAAVGIDPADCSWVSSGFSEYDCPETGRSVYCGPCGIRQALAALAAAVSGAGDGG